MSARPEQPEPFLRGAPWPATSRVSYPRVQPDDRTRVPRDTWEAASIPAGVRLEVTGDATELDIDYVALTEDLGYRGDGAGTTFSAWTRRGFLGQTGALVGEGRARVPLDPSQRTIVYLPEGMQPTVVAVSGVGGDVYPAPAQPRWVVYGDSIVEGWIASAPALAWPAVAGRALGLDVVNLGYAGAARGEVASAEQVAALAADVITVAHGTNCWTRTPHSIGLMRETTAAFLDIVRQGHPETPIVVVSPVVRPDAEATANRLGATLASLRLAMEAEVEERIAKGDGALVLVRGLDVLGPQHLGDGIHPNDEGHARLAAAIGAAVEEMI